MNIGKIVNLCIQPAQIKVGSQIVTIPTSTAYPRPYVTEAVDKKSAVAMRVADEDERIHDFVVYAPMKRVAVNVPEPKPGVFFIINTEVARVAKENGRDCSDLLVLALPSYAENSNAFTGYGALLRIV